MCRRSATTKHVGEKGGGETHGYYNAFTKGGKIKEKGTNPAKKWSHLLKENNLRGKRLCGQNRKKKGGHFGRTLRDVPYKGEKSVPPVKKKRGGDIWKSPSRGVALKFGGKKGHQAITAVKEKERTISS